MWGGWNQKEVLIFVISYLKVQILFSMYMGLCRTRPSKEFRFLSARFDAASVLRLWLSVKVVGCTHLVSWNKKTVHKEKG